MINLTVPALLVKETIYTNEELAFIKKHSALPRAPLTLQFNEKFNKNKQAIASVCKYYGWLADRISKKEVSRLTKVQSD